MPLPLIHNLKDSQLRKHGGYAPIKGVHWLVVFMSLIATLWAWQVSLHNAQARADAKFENHADYAIGLFEQEMSRYTDILKASVGFVAGSEEILQEEWRHFTQRIALEAQFPAIGGLGVIYRIQRENLNEFVTNQRRTRSDFTVRPSIDVGFDQSRRYVMPLTLIAPEKLEKTMPGLDIARESRRRDAIERSIKTGEVQITAPIRPEGIGEPGFAVIAPVFKTTRPATEALRQSEFIGAVVAAVVTKHLAQGILDSGIRQVALRVSDDAEIIYNELIAENELVDPQPLMTHSRRLSFYGRDWLFDVHSTKAFRLEQKNLTPTVILIGGLLIDVLLLLLFLHISRANRRAIAFGRKISRKYELQSEDLHHSNETLKDRNEQLEAFSYVVSHDLKAPLRAVGFLAECIEEDIEEQQPGLVLPAELTDQIRRIRKQVTLAQGLIKGILEYSGIGMEKEQAEEVNVLELLHSLRTMMTVDVTQLKLEGEYPTFVTYKTKLTQVLMNLISNGFKYNHRQALAKVTVRVEQSPKPGYYRFHVSDNGPGIAPANHEKIFEPFATLQPKDHSMSSGVGLAIVNKIVKQQGGTVNINSETGMGACFTFDWPHLLADQVDANHHVDLPKAA